MALSGDVLGTTIGTTLYNAIPQSIKNKMTSQEKTDMQNNLITTWKAIAADIVSHISTAGTVTVPAGIPVGPSPTSVVGATLSPGIGTIS